MSVIRTWLLVVPLLLSACASTRDVAPTIQIFNDDLRLAFDNLSQTMSAPRTPLTLASGASISTCREYLQQTDRIDRNQPDQMLALQGYVICDSVALLQHAQPVSMTSIGVGHALATRLDFRSFPSSRGPRISNQAFTFEQLTDAPLVIESNAAMLDSKNWYLRVERVAVADFDGNGQEDWLVWIGDDAHTGSYQAFQALIIYNVAATGMLTGDVQP